MLFHILGKIPSFQNIRADIITKSVLISKIKMKLLPPDPGTDTESKLLPHSVTKLPSESNLR